MIPVNCSIHRQRLKITLPEDLNRKIMRLEDQLFNTKPIIIYANAVIKCFNSLKKLKNSKKALEVIEMMITLIT